MIIFSLNAPKNNDSEGALNQWGSVSFKETPLKLNRIILTLHGYKFRNSVRDGPLSFIGGGGGGGELPFLGLADNFLLKESAFQTIFFITFCYENNFFATILRWLGTLKNEKTSFFQSDYFGRYNVYTFMKNSYYVGGAEGVLTS